MMIKSKAVSSIIFDILNYLFLALLALSCILPIIHILAVSFSNKSASAANMVRFLPVGFHVRAYSKVLNTPLFLKSFGIAGLRVFAGLFVNLFFICLTAYPLAKENREMKGRNFFAWLVFIPMLFSGGLIPTYLQVRNLGLIDSFWSLILPTAVPMFSIIILMNFFRGIPKSLTEAAQIEGAGHLTVLWKIYLPISKASIATLALFSIIGHWNEWFSGLIYINDSTKWPLQTYLRQILLPSALSGNLTFDDVENLKYLSDKNFKAAQVFISMVPILLIYPYLQRYFISGMTLGSVKE
ncbi:MULTISPECIES: carbohydrate ABC transporter permease [unclassified Oceanispirochaeta]|uniref:carbohydrate ABC transporter permease n=1 Tax=unclassified Oceanispirochaeta TaxID=2635722 RepID=UPI0018F37207|nr:MULTISPECIES: carbohydrate ABC transporter permease [unclassified Oceanispirochaeta]